MSLSEKAKAKAKADMTGNEGFLMNLPSEILVQILSRLPAIEVIKSKLVCRKWLKIFSSREFSKLRLSRSDPCLLAFKGDHFKIFKFGDENDTLDLWDGPLIEFDLSVFPNILQNKDVCVQLVSSVNGFVCLVWCYTDVQTFVDDGAQENLCVCNPITREYVTVPKVESSVEFDTMVNGFGVSIISGRYKIVRITHSLVYYDGTGDRVVGINNFECCVYTLGTGLWRTIDCVRFTYSYQDSDRSALFFNGNLHWLIRDFEGSELISCFDLEEESFRPFPPPPSSAGKSAEDLFSLGIVTGCLCLCDNTSVSDIAIWVMKEYGVKKSWTKDFVVRKVAYFGQHVIYGKIAPLKIFRDGDILFSIDRKYLFTYIKQCKTLGSALCNIEGKLHVSSFLSLKDFEREKVSMFIESHRHQDKL